ncbi:MAG: YicC/YloC family endoribonuclease, partial [Oscillospiraceae bacterium]
EQLLDGRDILVEIKSVNHRYFEYSARVPRAYTYLEEKIKTLISKVVSRGKIDVNVSVYTVEGKDAQVNINTELAKGYVESLRRVSAELNIVDDLSLTAIARFPEVFLVTKVIEDEELIWNEVEKVAMVALEKFAEMRVNEGKRMYDDIVSKLNQIEIYVLKVEELAPKSVFDYKTRLMTKLNEVLQEKDINEQRVLTEVAIFADKIAVDEETVRLKSHLKQFRELLQSNQPVGRKLDFLTQEINREVNTIGSKCQDVEITTTVVELKSEIEKVREQIQNIE